MKMIEMHSHLTLYLLVRLSVVITRYPKYQWTHPLCDQQKRLVTIIHLNYLENVAIS